MENPNLFEIAQSEINLLNNNENNVYSFGANLDKNSIELYAQFRFDLSVQAFYNGYKMDEIGYYGGNYSVAKYSKEIDGIQIKVIAYKDAPNK